MKTLRSLLIIFALLILLTMPVMAQEDNATVQALPDLTIDQALIIAIGIITAVLIGGAFILAIRAVDALGISVPQSTFDTVGDAVVRAMQQTMTDMQSRVLESATPFDDLIFSVGRAPADELIAELQRRGYGISSNPDDPPSNQ